jgi:hypothetical protein
MKTLLQCPGFGSFLFAQAQVAFNDSANKLTLIRCVDPPILPPKARPPHHEIPRQ